MFTGIIEEVGKIRAIERQAVSARLTVAASKVLSDVHLGDSIAVNGVCLTVTSFGRDYFCADVMHETLNRSSLGALGVKSPVNLERATVWRTYRLRSHRRNRNHPGCAPGRKCRLVYDSGSRTDSAADCGKRIDRDRRNQPDGRTGGSRIIFRIHHPAYVAGDSACV